MFFSRRRVTGALAAGGLGFFCARGKAFAAGPKPRLISLVISEQFRTDYIDRFGNFFVAGGFRRLRQEGSYFQDCQMAASTFTCSGLATLATGAYPELHGIVADTWYDRKEHKPVLASLEKLQGTTLSDEVMSADSRNRIFGVGGALSSLELLTGRLPTRLFSMLSDGEYEGRGSGPAMPWFEEYRQANPPGRLKGAGWQVLGGSKSVPPLRTLTADPDRPETFSALYRSSPFAQAAQFGLLRDLIGRERLGQGPATDVVAVSLDSMALLGYEVGADSPLMREMVLHLDREMEALLTLLDKSVGAHNYILAFSAAHGAVRQGGEPRARYAIQGEAVARSIQQALAAQYDVKNTRAAYVERYIYPFLYLRLDSLKRSYIDTREARTQAGRAALRVPGVAGYYTADGDCSHTGEWLRRFRNSFHAVRSGDVMLAYEPECVEDFGAGRGISYGSLYNYESRVPLILFGGPFAPQSFDYAVESTDVAPTLAHALGVAWPSSATGRVLADALASG